MKNRKNSIKSFGLGMLLASSLYADVNCTQIYDTQKFTERFYENVLERKADDEGLSNWTNHLVSKVQTGADVANGFVFSEEYTQKKTDNQSYLITLYKSFFNRDADIDGLQHWMEKLNTGTSRQEVLDGFTHSKEFETLASAYGIKAYDGALNVTQLYNFVQRFYKVVLARDADENGLNHWVTQLSTHTSTGSDIAFGFVFSEEYDEANKDDASYLTTLYQAFFNRPPDSVGFNHWIEKLAQGVSRTEILDNFLHSQEFIDLAKTYDIIAFEGAPTSETIVIDNKVPVAIIDSIPQAFVGDSVVFSALMSMDDDGEIACYWWEENHNLLSQEGEFVKDDFTLGQHYIRLTIADNSGETTSTSIELPVKNKDNTHPTPTPPPATQPTPTPTPPPETQPTPTPPPETTNQISQALLNTISYMGNEERLAYDVYNKLYTLWGTRQFTNIANNAEIKHIQEVQGLVQTYILDDNNFTNVDLPALGYKNTNVPDMQAGVYDISKIQTLYDTLVAQGSQSEIEAIKVACIVEVVDVNDLDTYITLAEQSNATDIINSFTMLRNGSYNHYWSFDSALIKKGVSTGCCSVGTVDGVNYCHPEYPR